MHAHSLNPWRHEHVFLGRDHARNERRSWAVVALCGAMMSAEIVGGLLWGSIALITDGLHMSTHAGALVIAALPTLTPAATPETNVSSSVQASSAISLPSPAPLCWR